MKPILSQNQNMKTGFYNEEYPIDLLFLILKFRLCYCMILFIIIATAVYFHFEWHFMLSFILHLFSISLEQVPIIRMNVVIKGLKLNHRPIGCMNFDHVKICHCYWNNLFSFHQVFICRLLFSFSPHIRKLFFSLSTTKCYPCEMKTLHFKVRLTLFSE